MKSHSVLGALVAVSAACWSTPSPRPAEPPVTSAPTASGSAAPSPPALSEADVASLEAAMDAAIEACTIVDYVEAWLCPMAHDFNHHPLIESGRAEAWLLAELDGSNWNRRLFALSGLAIGGVRYRTDETLAAKVLDVTAALPEEVTNPCGAGWAVGRISASQTHLTERITQVLDAAPAISSVPQCFAFSALEGDFDTWFPHLLRAVSDPEPNRLQSGAIGALEKEGAVPPARLPEACAALAGALRHHGGAPDTAELAAGAGLAVCPRDRSEVLRAIGEWASSGTFRGTGGLAGALTRGGGDASDRAARLAVARTLLETDGNDTGSRVFALEALFALPDGKALAERFAKGPPDPVWDKAQELLGQAPREKVSIAHGHPALRQAMWSRVEEVRGCYRDALKEDATLAGSLTLSAETDERGDITKIDAHGELPAALKRCIATVARGLGAPKLEGSEFPYVSVELSLR